MIQFQENPWIEGWKEGQTLFYRTLPASTRGPITMKSEWHTLNHIEEVSNLISLL